MMKIENFSGYEFTVNGGFPASINDAEWAGGVAPQEINETTVRVQTGSSVDGGSIIRHENAFRVRDNADADHIFATRDEAESWLAGDAE